MPVEVISGSGYVTTIIWPPGLQVPATTTVITGVAGSSGGSGNPYGFERRHSASGDTWNAPASGSELAASASAPSGGQVAAWIYPAIRTASIVPHAGIDGYVFAPVLADGYGAAAPTISSISDTSEWPRTRRTYSIGGVSPTTYLVAGTVVTVTGTDYDGWFVYQGQPVAVGYSAGSATVSVYLDEIHGGPSSAAYPQTLSWGDGDASLWFTEHRYGSPRARSAIVGPRHGGTIALRGVLMSTLGWYYTGNRTTYTVNSVVAPILQGAAPDFAVDADCPNDWGNVRVVWADGLPTLVARTPPSSCTIRTTGRRTVPVGLISDSYPETAQPRRSAVLSGETRYPLIGANTSSTWHRGDMRCEWECYPSNVATGQTDKVQFPLLKPVTITSVTAVWRAVKADGTDGAIVGTPYPLTYTRIPSTPTNGSYVSVSIPGENIGTPPDLGPVARRLVLNVRVQFTYYATVYDNAPISGEVLTSYAGPRMVTIGALPYWPWDVAKLALAPDDVSCRYVGQAGWRHGDTTQDVAVTWTAPVFARSATQITFVTYAQATRVREEYGTISAATSNRQLRWFCPATGQGGGNISDSPIDIPVESRAYPIVVRYARCFTQASTIGGPLVFSNQWTVTLNPP